MDKIFIEKFKNLLEESNKKQNEIAKEMGYKKQKITNLKTGYIDPQLDDLRIISKYFQCTTDYLLGIETKEEQNNNKYNKCNIIANGNNKF